MWLLNFSHLHITRTDFQLWWSASNNRYHHHHLQCLQTRFSASRIVSSVRITLYFYRWREINSVRHRFQNAVAFCGIFSLEISVDFSNLISKNTDTIKPRQTTLITRSFITKSNGNRNTKSKYEKSAQRDANTARALAVARFGHRPPARPLSQTHRQDQLKYTAPQLASAQCNNITGIYNPLIARLVAEWSVNDAALWLLGWSGVWLAVQEG